MTLPGFHDTPARLDALEAAAREDRAGRLAEVKAELEGILDRRALGSALSRDDLPIRLVHNDAKLDNVLFDTATGEALCVVDLDTVMPGVVGHDFGDMVRSMSTRAPEDAAPGDLVEVDLSLFAAMTRGYLGVMGPHLSRVETQSLVPAGMVSTLEVAARFLTDHLQGDVYFRIDRPGQNLDRTRTQLALLESLIDARPRLEEIVVREAKSDFRIWILDLPPALTVRLSSRAEVPGRRSLEGTVVEGSPPTGECWQLVPSPISGDSSTRDRLQIRL